MTELDCPEGSQIVLDVRNDIVICARSSLKSPPSLVFGKLPSQGCEHKILWTAVTTGQSVASLDSLVCHYMTLAQEDESQASCSKSVQFCASPSQWPLPARYQCNVRPVRSTHKVCCTETADIMNF